MCTRYDAQSSKVKLSFYMYTSDMVWSYNKGYYGMMPLLPAPLERSWFCLWCELSPLGYIPPSSWPLTSKHPTSSSLTLLVNFYIFGQYFRFLQKRTKGNCVCFYYKQGWYWQVLQLSWVELQGIFFNNPLLPIKIIDVNYELSIFENYRIGLEEHMTQ